MLKQLTHVNQWVHDQNEALSLADQVAVMRAGRLVQSAPPSEVYLSPTDPQVAEFVGRANRDLITRVQVAEYLREVIHGGSAFHINPVRDAIPNSDDERPLRRRGDGRARDEQ